MIQTEYMKATSKPKHLSAKQWINRLVTMNDFIYWMSEDNYKMGKRELNQNWILPNIPLEWQVEFEKSAVQQNIRCAMGIRQSSSRIIIDDLERLEKSEKTQKRIELIKARRNPQHNNNNNRRENMYRKPGHNHEWRHCPDNPNQVNNNNNNNNSNQNNINRRVNNSNDQDDSSRDDEYGT